MTRSLCDWKIAAVAMAFLLPIATRAASIAVAVGYADDLRPSPYFPSPWQGDPNVDLFAGGTSPLDAGAIRIDNTGATDVSLEDLSVTFLPAISPSVFSIWSSQLPFVLHPGKTAIFTQTTQYDFDTSDVPALVAPDLANNCSTGPLASSATCVANAPIVTVVANGDAASFLDTAHVLDTGGFDANCCLPFGNESLAWRPIGTSGIENLPEPTTVLLLGGGLVALGSRRRTAARA